MPAFDPKETFVVSVVLRRVPGQSGRITWVLTEDYSVGANLESAALLKYPPNPVLPNVRYRNCRPLARSRRKSIVCHCVKCAPPRRP